jgi:outer membrane protein assembly factor BamB
MSIILSLLAVLLSVPASAPADWPAFGGPHRNFTVDAPVPPPWSEKGPREIWSRSLGEGYSSISVFDGVLYTMYRKDEQEVFIAIDAKSGKTVWEYSYESSTKGFSFGAGPGPHGTPTVTADRVFAAGTTGILHALDRKTGKLIWQHDLIDEYHGTLRDNGYACSPLIYGDTIIMMVGGKEDSVMAFRQSDGSVVWHNSGFQNSTSSPLLVKLGGQEQVLAFLFEGIAGFDPHNGKLLWSFPHTNEHGLNVTLPVLTDDGQLFLSCAYSGGSRLLKLIRTGEKTTAEELWFTRRMRIQFANAMVMGDRVYGSSGDMTGIFTALDMKTGKVAWQDRTVGIAQMLRVSDRLIILSEDGNLILATPGDSGLKIEAKAPIFDGQSWTPPTLIGSTLYARDRKMIRAFDLKN